MARLYADEDFPLPVVDELRRLGHDVRTVQEAGRGGQQVPDADVLKDAIAEKRILPTRPVSDGLLSIENRIDRPTPSHMWLRRPKVSQ